MQRPFREAVARFVRINRRGARRIERGLGHPVGYEHHPLQARYVDVVAAHANAVTSPTIVDVGAGRHCQFAERLGSRETATIIGIDVERDALDANPDLDRRIVVQPGERWPLEDEAADLVVSMSTLEHIERMDSVAGEISRVLRPRGVTIHIFPSRNAPFALLNRFLPEQVKRRLLRTLIPGSEGIQGFPAFYDRCTVDDMLDTFAGADLRVEHREWTFYQSDYYAFFLPAYIVSLAYDLLMTRLNRPAMAAAALIVARKPGP